MTRCLMRRPGLFSVLLLLTVAGPLAQEAGPAPPGEAAPAADAVVLSLQDCLKAALEGNLDIRVRRYDPLMSEAQVTLQHSTFDPLLTGRAGSSEDESSTVSRQFGTPLTFQSKSHDYAIGFEDPLITGGRYRLDLTGFDNDLRLVFIDPVTGVPVANTSTEVDTRWTLTVTHPLLRNLGPRSNRWQIVVARNTLGASESQFRQTVIDTLSAAEKAYWDLNFALMDLKTKRASLQLAKDFLEQNRIKVRVGTLAPIEITQAEAGVADREEGVIVAEYAVRTAEDVLRRIMNVPRGSPEWSRPIQPADAPPLVETATDVEAAVAAAEGSRPDLEQARLNVRSKEAELAYRKNQRRWALDFTGTYGYLGVDFDELDPVTMQPLGSSYGDALDLLREREQPSWVATLNLSIPIGNRQAAANFTNAEYAVSQARYDLERLEQAARVEVRNAARMVETNLKRVRAAQVNVRLQREKLAAEQKKFENGMSTSFQVLQFQTDLTSAESRENQAIVDYNKSLAEMERVKGTLLEAKGIVMPSGAGESKGEAQSAALRGLWRRGGERRAAGAGFMPAGDAAPAVVLPTAFTFEHGRLMARGGSAGEPAGEVGGAARR